MEADLLRDETLSGPLERMRNDNILVRLGDRADRDGVGGRLIVVPDMERRGRSEQLARVPMWGTVAMVGDRVRGAIRPGDRVLVVVTSGEPVWIDGREHRVVREAAVQAVAEPAEERDTE